MAETWTQKQRRRERERREAERRRKRRRRRRRSPVDDILKMPGDAANKAFRKLRNKARREVKRRVRKMGYRARKRMFGLCPTCNKANSPGHTCRMSFSEYNAHHMRRRWGKQGGLPASSQNPNIWQRNP